MADFALSNDIYIGSTAAPLHHFINRRIKRNSARGVFAVDVVGNELSIDTFSFVVRYRYDVPIIYAPKGKSGYLDTNNKIYRMKPSGIAQYFKFVPSGSDALIDTNDDVFRVFAGYNAAGTFDIPYGTPVFWYIGGTLFSKGYLKSVDRVGKFAWKFTCISGIGLLDAKMHNGGLYAGQPLINIVRNIIGDAFSITASSDTGSTKMYGHLPYDTARNNLHTALFAAGAALIKNNASYDYSLRWLDSQEISIPSSRVSILGSVDYQLPSNVAEVTEHAFFSTSGDEVVQLFDTNGQVVDNLTVVFDQSPIHSLTTTGTLTIISSSVNHAVVSGNGTLSGKLYTHTRRLVTATNRRVGDQERVCRVTENEMVSAANSRNVARRVLGFYSSAKTVKLKMLLNNERTGNLISTVDAFGEETTGILSSMEVTPTTVKGANCEIVSGYTPEYFGNNYSNRVLITASGTWSVPSGVTEIRIVLIGAGSGGAGGYDGKAGQGKDNGMEYQLYYLDPEYEPVFSRVYYPGGNSPQSGGAGGAGGEPGLHFVVDTTVVPGEVITLNLGAGGAGGAANGGAGSAGGDTTASSTSLGTITSAAGVDVPYYDPISGVTYCKNGATGYRGGSGGASGGDGDPYSGRYSGADGGDGRDGGSVAGFAGGKGGAGTGYTPVPYPISAYWADDGYLANGAGGGGAAYGNVGGAGGVYTIETSHYLVSVYGAAGGNGADAIAPAQATYGNGGRGGNGGGSGGNASGARCYHPAVDYDVGGYPVLVYANGGAAGHGSIGGKGGDGCVLIYY